MLKYELPNSSTEVSEEVLLYLSTKADSLSKHDCLKDNVKLSGAGNKLMEDKADSDASDEIADAHSKNNNASERLIKNFCCSWSFNSNELRDEPEDNQDPSTAAILAESMIHKKEVYSNVRNTTMNKGTMRIKHNSDSLLTMILSEKSKELAQVEQLFKAGKMQENADTLSKNSIVSLSRQSTVGLPEYENFKSSGASPPSGRLTVSGSVPYSDTISLNSNSTSSTRSFAFPILATEWNESPVRMVEADRRRLKKPRCWRLCFTCCTF